MALTDLAGFPMLMTVSQDAINAQMAKVYGQSTHDPDDMFPNVPWNLGPTDKSWGLTVSRFAAPEVDFDTQVIMGCRLKMTIMDGHFTTWAFKGMVDGKPTMEQQDIPLDGVTMYVTTPMKQQVHDKWSDTEFEAQALFADLENMHLIEFDLSTKLELAILGTVESSLKTVIAGHISSIGIADPKALVFGSVRIPPIAAAEETTGLLTPTAVAFSTTKIRNESGAYKSGVLNYLLWNENPKQNPIPTGDAVGAFDAPLLRPGDQATLVMSEATVLDTIARLLIETQFTGIDLGLTREGTETTRPNLFLNKEFDFGVTINDRGRSAKLMSIDSTIIRLKDELEGYRALLNKFTLFFGPTHVDRLVNQLSSKYQTELDVNEEDSLIKIKYRITSSIYGAFRDIDIDSTSYRLVRIYLKEEKLKVKISSPARVTYSESSSSPFGDHPEICTFEKWVGDDLCSTVFNNLNLPGKKIWNFTSATLDRNLYVTATYE